MEVILPWERDDIKVRSTPDESSEETEENLSSALAPMMLNPTAAKPTAKRIQQLAEGVQVVADTSGMTTDDVLSQIEAELEAREAADSEQADSEQ